MSVSHHDSARASRTLSAFLLFVLGVGLTVGLYYVKTRAQTARAEVASMERDIASERAAIAVLRAEIAYLERPERLAELAKDRLMLAAVDPARVVGEDAVLAIPMREEPSQLQSGEGAP